MDDQRFPFVVVANRLPVDRTQGEDGSPEWTRSPGGLVSALDPIARSTGGAWVGWSGSPDEEIEPFEDGGLYLRPVPLSADDVDRYYEGQSNSTIWPLFHDSVEQSVHRRAWRVAYEVVNRRFAEAAAEVAEDGATVWVHDYQLLLVPQLLRDLRPDLRIGFFLHIPFPPVELFMQLPRRTELLRGLLGADLVGFQQPLAAQNFVRLAERLAGVRSEGERIEYEGRTVTARAFPISIDVAEVDGLAADPEVQAEARRLRRDLGGDRRLLLGVDRLDYTKGIEQRIEAYGELLAAGTISNDEAVLVQVATPSRMRVEQYRQLRERVEREVGRINGEFGRVGEPAIHYLIQPFDRAELAALYRTADVMVVTPLRDGMNLVAKEFVAARADGTGALVLSEFAGAAAELEQAFLVNPHDVDGLKATLLEAMSARPEDLAARMEAMRSHLDEHDIVAWARAYLTTLDRTGRVAAAIPKQTDPQQPVPSAASR